MDRNYIVTSIVVIKLFPLVMPDISFLKKPGRQPEELT